MQNANSQFASEWSIWGRIVESRGPRILLASSFAFFLVDQISMTLVSHPTRYLPQ